MKLEQVLGLTVCNNCALDCNSVTGNVAYPAGSVAVVYNIKRNKQYHIINNTLKSITSLSFSSDGKYLATGECGNDPCVRVWDLSSGQQVASSSGHKYGINCVAFSPNMKYVVSIGSHRDKMVNVWDWQNDIKIASNTVSCKVKAISFSENGEYFVTVGNRHVKFWYLQYSKSPRNKMDTAPLMGRSAILGDQRNNYFCDVACGLGEASESTFAIARSGLLCEFNNRRLLDKWVELRTTSANCLSTGHNIICVGCADGIIRCFNPINLQFICTLPRPHTLGIDIAKGLNRSEVGANGANTPFGSNPKFPSTIAIICISGISEISSVSANLDPSCIIVPVSGALRLIQI
uniref:Uncharacterized protein n=1 Tax=Tetranychus urticae TaxID=32264 RepID=T1KN36_TETUR